MSLFVQIRKKYGNFSLDVNLDNTGNSMGLLGASGCGKSLTLRCVAGIETPDSGRIVLNGETLFDSEKSIRLNARKRRTGLLFQNYALFPNMTAEKNIEAGVRNKKERKRTVEELAGLLRIGNKLDRYPWQLSGGEQQRVAIARVLAYAPDILLFDEPFSALDSFLKEGLQQDILKALQRYKGEVLMVSHSREELYRFCGTIAVMYKGRIIESGDKADIFHKPANLTTAKLTGCKNISAARRISDHCVEALDWKLCLNTEQRVPEKTDFVGIRAHNLKPCSEGRGSSVLRVTQEDILEGPFENCITLRIDGISEDRRRIYWTVSRQDWKEVYRGRPPEFISIPAEHVLLLTGT